MRDEWFIRGNVPMTKSEVRAVSLSKLELTGDSVLWDVGAGTGSVSVEAARLFPKLRVVAFECRREAAELIRANCRKAGAENVQLVEGRAPESFALPAPTHAFIGGTSGQMRPVLDWLLAHNPGVRVVLNVIALESLAEILKILGEKGIEPEIVSLQVSRAEKAGKSHLMKGQNPVYIISFGGET